MARGGDGPAETGGGKRRKKKKERFVARLRRRGRETVALGSTLVRQPRAFPGEATRLLKRSFRAMWMARGGGFYAVGFVITFLWLELRTIVTEIATSDGVGSFVSEQLVEFLFRFSLQSIGNTVRALLWPLLAIERYEAWGLAVLAAGYLFFDALLKEPLSAWLFDGEPPSDEDGDSAA